MNRGIWGSLCMVLLGCNASTSEDGVGGAEAETAASSTTEASAGQTTTDASTDGTAVSVQSSSATGAGPMLTAVQVRDTQGPVADAVAFASDAAGGLVEEVRTDADGKALLAMPEGGSVSIAHEAAVYQDGLLTYSREIISQLGPVQGAEATFLVTTSGTSYAQPPANAPMRVSAFAYVQNNAVATPTMDFLVSCQDRYTTAFGYQILDAYEGCPGQATFAIYAMGYDASGKLVAEGKLTDLPHVPGGNVTHQVAMHPVSRVPTTLMLPAPSAPGYELEVALLGRAPDGAQWLARAAQATSITHEAYPPGLFDRYFFWAYVTRGGDRSGFVRMFPIIGAPPQHIAVNADEIAAVRVAAFDRTDPAHPSMTLALDPGPLGDFVVASLRWGDERVIHWRGYATPDRTIEMRMPRLPPSIAAWTIQEGETMQPVQVRHEEAALTTSALDGASVDLYETDRTYTYASGE